MLATSFSIQIHIHIVKCVEGILCRDYVGLNNYLAIRFISGSFLHQKKKYSKLKNRSILPSKQTLEIVNIHEQVEWQ